MDDSERDPTLVERWAASLLAQGRLTTAATLLVPLAFIVLVAVRSAEVTLQLTWVFAALWVLLALGELERVGVRRLLARREAQIARLRSGSGSA